MNHDDFKKYVKYGLAAILVGIGGFASLFLIKSLLTLAIVSVGGILLVQFLPLLSEWATIMKMRGFKALWASNPIPALWEQYRKDAQRIEDTTKEVKSFATETKNYKTKLDSFIANHPEKADSFRDTYDKMVFVLNTQVQALRAAKTALGKFSDVIDEATAVYEMTQAAQRANSLLRKFNMGDPMDDIRKKTALDAVTSSLNNVMADLETSMAIDYTTVDSRNAIELNPSQVIEDAIVETKENQYVQNRN